jgi:hypothetical protein
VIRSALAVLALVFAVAHAPYLVSSLEDIDSVNFALGLRDFDVAAHQPHPPGYPVYIAIGRIGLALVESVSASVPPSAGAARALSLLSLLGGLTAIFLLYRVLACWSRPSVERSGAAGGAAAGEDAVLTRAPWQRFDARAVAATALVVACPLYWYLSVRPMSDVPGLAAALAAQACLALAWWRQRPHASGDRRLSPERMAASGQMIVAGALVAGIAIGFRSQNAVLTLPLLAGVLLDRVGRGVAGALLGSAVAFTVGVLLWAVPLMIASGGLNEYLAALGSQAGEDFAGVDMLYSNPSPRLAAFALLRTFVYPWDSVVLGSVIVALAVAGTAGLVLRDRRSLVGVLLVTVPYLAFHLLFQDTAFVRYALPLVPPVAFLAVTGLELLARRAVVPLAGVLAVWSVMIAAPVTASYASEASPTTRALRAMDAAQAEFQPGALAMHQTFRRPLEAEAVTITPLLAAPPRREWLEMARYWREGHTAPLWLLADPRRTDLALIDPRSRADRTDFVWPFSSLSDIGGMRPMSVAWYRLPPPGWFVEEGWALTPEAAGIARLMGRGPAEGPITAWVRRRADAARVVIGGRHLGRATDPAARFVVTIDGEPAAQWESEAGFFVHVFDLPAGTLVGDGPLARLTVESAGVHGEPVPTAIEQFDLQTRGAMMWAYEEGWHEAEYDAARGVWRWTSERATLRVVDASGPIVITFRVEQPRRHFEDDPQVRLLAGDRVLAETVFRDSDRWTVDVPAEALVAADGRVTLETTRTFVPAERTGAPDRRRLGLRVFDVMVSKNP